jgi:hypothetical protein
MSSNRFASWNRRRKLEELFKKLKTLSVNTPEVGVVLTDDGIEIVSDEWFVVLVPNDRREEDIPF